VGKRIYNKPVELTVNGKNVIVHSPSGMVLQLIVKMGYGNCDILESRNIRTAVQELCQRVTKKYSVRNAQKKRPLRPRDHVFIAAARWASNNGLTPKEALKIFQDLHWQPGDPLPVKDAADVTKCYT
jgi:hypothetical protein